MLRRGLLRLTVVLVATAVPLVAIEIGLRLYGYEAFRWSDRVNPQLLTATGNDELPYVLTPNASGRGWDTDVVVNSHGFRDREFNEHKDQGAIRIVAIGDSITFGSRIAEPDDLYPKRLERLLRRHRATRRAEVLNFGVTGYDVVNNVEHLRVRALAFQPDAVVMAFCLNDIGYASTAMTYVQAQKYLGHPVFRFRVAQLVFSSVLQVTARSQLRDNEGVDAFARVNRARIRSIANDAELTAGIDRLKNTPRGRHVQDVLAWWTERERIGFLEFAFNKLRDLSGEHGFDVVIVPVPLLDETSIAQWRVVNEIIQHESLKFGFRVVDVTGPFEGAGLRRLRNHPADFIHPGPKGHAIIADELAAYFDTVGSRR